MAFLFIFLLGFVDGLRSLTPPALVCWAARFGWLHFAGTKLAFVNHWLTLTIFTVLALVELVGDKLPNTPARTAALGLSARVCLGGSCGLAVATSQGMSLWLSVLLGAMGGFAGAFAGYYSRRFIVTKARVPDFIVAIAEDVITVAGGLLILCCVGR